MVLSAARSRAGSLVGRGQRRLGATSEWVASSAASIRSRLPSISFYGRSTPSLTENPWSSAQNEDPPSSGAFDEEDHGLPWASDGAPEFWEVGEAPPSLFSIGLASDDDEFINDELTESTIIWGND